MMRLQERAVHSILEGDYLRLDEVLKSPLQKCKLSYSIASISALTKVLALSLISSPFKASGMSHQITSCIQEVRNSFPEYIPYPLKSLNRLVPFVAFKFRKPVERLLFLKMRRIPQIGFFIIVMSHVCIHWDLNIMTWCMLRSGRIRTEIWQCQLIDTSYRQEVNSANFTCWFEWDHGFDCKFDNNMQDCESARTLSQPQTVSCGKEQCSAKIRKSRQILRLESMNSSQSFAVLSWYTLLQNWRKQ